MDSRRFILSLAAVALMAALTASSAGGVKTGPSDSPREEGCDYCYPNLYEGACRTVAHKERGYTECENIPGGGCDMRDGEQCVGGETKELANFRPDQFEFENGFIGHGKLLAPGVFALRTCSGFQAEVIYTSESLVGDRMRVTKEIHLN